MPKPRKQKLSRKQQVAEFVKNYKFDFKIRPALRLGEVERQLDGIIVPTPSRPTLIKLVKSGILEGKKTRFGYIVYQDSFHSWLKKTAA